MQIFRFDTFEFDPQAAELRRRGIKLRVYGQPTEILTMLLKRPGEVVRREELRARLWPADTFVDFEHSLNAAVNKLREALGDSADKPKFIETIPRRGYRFIARVEATTNGQPSSIELSSAPVSDAGTAAAGFTDGRSFTKRRSWLLVPSGLALLLMLGAATVIYRYSIASRSPHVDLQHMTMTRLTDTGNVGKVAISPNGQYLAYVSRDSKGESSLWARQIATDSPVQILAPSQGLYRAITFSADGNYVYFVRNNEGYSVPITGGAPVQIVHNTMGGIAASTDGKKLAFYHQPPLAPQSELLVANSDGTNPHVIAEHSRSSGLVFQAIMPPSWSPDGKLIAMPLGRDADSTVGIYPVAGGAPRIIPFPGFVVSALWLPDQKGLLVSSDPSATAISAGVPAQLWLLPYPEGSPQRLTYDLDAYRSTSLTSDGKLLAAVQVQVSYTVFVGPAGDPDKSHSISPGKLDGIGLRWMPDGSLLSQNVTSQFSILAPETKERVPLFQDDVFSGNFSVCKNGRFIILMKQQLGNHSTIWRVDSTGGNAKQLTQGPADMSPYCSPDGKHVVYVGASEKSYRAMKIRVDGGPPVVLSDGGDVLALQYSPDGHQVADLEAAKNDKVVLVIRDAETGKASKTFAVFSPQGTFNSGGWDLEWTPDGRAIDYTREENTAVNLWSQPLSGGPARQITHFPDQIVCFDWSPDGKRIAFTRKTDSRNVVLFSNFH